MKKSVFRLYRNKIFSAILSVCMIAVTVLTGAAPLTGAETVLDNLAIGAAAFCDVTHKDFPASGLTDGNTTFDNGHTMIVQNTASFSIILDLGQMTTFNRLTLVPSADSPAYFVGSFTVKTAGDDGQYQEIKQFPAPPAPSDQTPVNFDLDNSVSARYVRLEIVSPWTGEVNDSRIAELQLYKVDRSKVNLAADAAVSCGEARSDFPASGLTDESLAFDGGHTMVVQGVGSFTIDLDLGDVKTFNRLTLVPAAQEAERFVGTVTIKTAGLDQSYQEVKQFAAPPVPKDQTPVDFDLVDSVSARYVRLEIAAYWNGYENDSRIAELRLYQVDGMAANLAVDASVSCGEARSDFPASGLTDENLAFDGGHTMIVQGVGSFTVDLDLGDVKDFNRLTLVPAAQEAERFIGTVTVKTAGLDQVYQEVKQFSAPPTPTNQTPVNFDLDDRVSARYVRLEIVAYWNGYENDSRIAELRIFDCVEEMSSDQNLALGAAVICDAARSDFPSAGLTDENLAFDGGHTTIVQNAVSFTINLDLGESKTFNRLSLIPASNEPDKFVDGLTIKAAGEDRQYQEMKKFSAPDTPTDQTPVNFELESAASARYIQIEIASHWTGGGYDSRIAELALYHVETPVPPAEEETDNLAFGASVTCDAAHPDFPASYLTDGNYAFEGHTMVVQTTNPFTITVDLGEVKSFNRLTLIPSADNPGWFLPNFALHAAGENGEFSLVKEFGTQSAPTDQTPVNYDIYEGVTARYLRLEVPNAWWNGMSNDSRVAELELYNVEDLTPPAEEETDNLAFGASVTCDAAHPDFPASYLTDGNYAFEGHTMVVQTAEPFTVTVDLGEEKTFNTLTLVPSADNPGWFFPNFTIHAAGEDGTFSLIESIRVREAPVDQTPISYYLHRDVTARYLQLEISGGWWNGMSNDSRVAELELYYAEPLDKVPLRVMDATASYDYGLEGGIPTGTKYLTDGNTDPSSGMYFNVSESASQGKLFDDAVTITLLMQKPAMVHEILVYAGRNWPSTFAVSLSADGGRTWGEPVALVADLTWGRAGNCYTLAIEPQKANAVKILFADVVPAETAWGTFGYLSLSEIEVYGKFIDEVLPAPAQKPDVKYSYDKIDMSHYLDGYRADAWPGDPTSYNSWDIRSEWLEITDSLEHTDYTPRYSKAFLIDGKYQLGGDAWASYRVGPDGSAVGLDTNEVNQTIRLKLPNKYLVGQIALCAKLPNSNNFPKDFTISVSTDGRNWKVVREVTDFHLTNGRSQQLFAFDPAEASYIKLDIATVGGTIDDVNVGWGASLTELEVYRVTSTSVNTGEANTWPIVGVVAVATISVFIGCVCFGKRRRTSVQG